MTTETFPVLDPATGDTVGEVPDHGVDDALAALDRAHAAGPDWAARAPRERAEVLRTAYEAVIAREDELAALIVAENGKTTADALGEVRYAAEFFRWYAEEAVRNEGSITTAPAGGKRILVTHQPIGVALLVTPWNFPAAMATRKIGPALAAGCTMLLKPASATPLTAVAIVDVLTEAGVPEGVVELVTTRASGPVVEALLADRRVRKLSFTGSTEVGSVLLGQAAANIVDCSMELGGNAPFIVASDADVDAAVAGAMVAKMRNGGEACTAANRFYVADEVHEAFVERFAAAMDAVTMGRGDEDGVGLGPLIDEHARDGVHALVTGACHRGAKAVVGGAVPERRGAFYPPTVLVDVAPDDAILDDEIFGPVAPIVRFGDIDEAVELANDTHYGLVAYLYTRDLRAGLAIAERLEYGMVGLNEGLVSDPAAPFGGVKASGLGREGGHEGMAEFLESKYIATTW